MIITELFEQGVMVKPIPRSKMAQYGITYGYQFIIDDSLFYAYLENPPFLYREGEYGFGFGRPNFEKGFIDHELTNNRTQFKVLPTIIKCLEAFAEKPMCRRIFFCGFVSRQSQFYSKAFHYLKNKYPQYHIIEDNGSFIIDKDWVE